MQLTYIQSNHLEPHKIAVHEFGERKNSAVVLLHAFTHNGKFFKPLAEYLSSKGLYVIAPDMPGRGESEYLQNSKNYNYHLYVNDLFLILNYLKIETVHLFGNSMGGLISVMFTEKYPRMVHKILLNDIGVVAPSAESMRIGRHVGRDFFKATKGEMIKRIDEEFLQSNLSLDELEYVFENYTLKTDAGFIFNYDQRLGDAFWMGDKQIRIPDLDFTDDFGYLRKTCKHLELYVIRGERSKLLDQQNYERLAECSQFRESMIIPSKGHLPLFFDESQSQKIYSWLSGN